MCIIVAKTPMPNGVHGTKGASVISVCEGKKRKKEKEGGQKERKKNERKKEKLEENCSVTIIKKPSLLQKSHRLEKEGEHRGLKNVMIGIMSIYLLKGIILFLLSTLCPAHLIVSVPPSLCSHHHKIAVNYNGHLCYYTSGEILVVPCIRTVTILLLRVQKKKSSL